MPRISTVQAGGANVCAFLDMLAQSEIGQTMLELSDDGYNVLVGSTPRNMRTFDSYADHPLPTTADAVEYAAGAFSTAAGRYQILSRYWQHYKRQLSLPDFGPVSQDLYAIQQIREQRALDDLKLGRFAQAVEKCRNIWASLPGAGYGQYEHNMDHLAECYLRAGGTFEGGRLDWYDETIKRQE